jgi:energy-coupling factor transporter ATP-binding protein EcfA2
MPGRVQLLLGPTGCGKTRLLKSLLADETRLVIVDTLSEFDDIARRVRGDEFRSILLSNPDVFRLAYAPPCPAAFEWGVEACAARPKIALAVDELDFWIPSAVHELPPAIFSILMQGRHFEQRAYFCAHRPGDVSPRLRSQAIVWGFPMHELRDRKFFVESTGFDPSTLQIIEEDAEEHIIKTELVRVERGRAELFTFDLVSGVLSPSRASEKNEDS